jgi:diaminopimelate decarboxylase
VADGPEDAAAIFARARAVGKTPRYLLRLRAEDARTGQRAFGMDAAEVPRVVERARRNSLPPPAGLAFHLGTGLPGIAPYRRTILAAARIAAFLRQAGSPVEILDVGGGFSSDAESRYDDRGRPHRVRWTEPERIVRDLTFEVRRRIGEPEIWIEPGRALVAEAFLLVSRVIRVRARRVVFVDASRMAHGFFIARGAHPVSSIPPRRGERSVCSIAGPLGTDLDVFVRRARMVPPREGDLLVFGAVGAYNLIAANGWAGPVPTVLDAEDLRST